MPLRVSESTGRRLRLSAIVLAAIVAGVLLRRVLSQVAVLVLGAGMLIGGSAATVFGIMNWQTERSWNRKARQTGSWISDRAGDLAKKL